MNTQTIALLRSVSERPFAFDKVAPMNKDGYMNIALPVHSEARDFIVVSDINHSATIVMNGVPKKGDRVVVKLRRASDENIKMKFPAGIYFDGVLKEAAFEEMFPDYAEVYSMDWFWTGTAWLVLSHNAIWRLAWELRADLGDADEYIPGQTYAKNAFCKKDGTLYYAKEANTDAAWTAAHWQDATVITALLSVMTSVDGCVSYMAQSETDTRKTQARANIGAMDALIGSVINHGADDTTGYTLIADRCHVWGEVAALDISTLQDAGGSYMVEFISGATATTLTTPLSVKWPAGFTVETNKIYQIGIIHGCAHVAKYAIA